MLLSCPSAVETAIAIAPIAIDTATRRRARRLSMEPGSVGSPTIGTLGGVTTRSKDAAGAGTRPGSGGPDGAVTRVSVVTGAASRLELAAGAAGEMASASGAKHNPHHRAS